MKIPPLLIFFSFLKVDFVASKSNKELSLEAGRTVAFFQESVRASNVAMLSLKAA